MSTNKILEVRISEHEKICIEKYSDIKFALRRIEGLLIVFSSAVIGLLIQIVMSA